MTEARGPDAAARQRIARSLDESLFVEAAAGTGKTTELIGRIVAVLASGRTTVDRLVAVTFTRKAAGELKLRLRHRLDSARLQAEDPASRQRLEDAVARLEEARIGTIHSFCAELLRERPVEAGIDPDFLEIDEDESRRLYQRCFDGWIQEQLHDMPAGLRRALARLALDSPVASDPPLGRLRHAGQALLDWRDYPESWRRELFPRRERVDQLVEDLRRLAVMVVQGPPRDRLRRALDPVVAEATWIERAERAGPREYDVLEARLVELRRQLARNRAWKGRGARFGSLDRESVQRLREELMGGLEAFREAADADLAVALRQTLEGSVTRYEATKAREGRLDFLDLLLGARRLLRDQPEVRGYLQGRFSHLFVDEFQDTDPLQAEILLLLAADDPQEGDWRKVTPVPGKLFVVGDPKQSIYRFRRADVALYRQIRERLEARGVGVVHLTRSFRSVRPLQLAVNHAFAPAMTGTEATGEPDYIPLAEHRPGREDQPSLVVVPAPKPYGWSRIAAFAVEACLPDAMAAFVHWLLTDSGWTIEDPEAPGSGRRIEVQPHHVAILFRRFLSWRRDVSRDYVKALEAREVPHVLLGGRSFHQREEVETLRSALHAIEWPDDELSVFATLKGSLFALPDELLLRYRHEVGKFHPFTARPGGRPDLEPIREALGQLAELHRRRNRIPIAETVHALLTLGRAHAAFALRPAGNQVLSNVLHVLDLARSFEMSGGISFRRFVERLDEQAESNLSRQAPVVEEGAEGVRLMTVHSAKGLEFPVVLLADPTAKLASAEPSAHVDGRRGLWAGKLLGCSPWELVEQRPVETAMDRAEGVRIAYVAATRARDLLVVPGVGDEPLEGWLEPLNRSIYPPSKTWRFAQVPTGCPPFEHASVLERPMDFDREPEASVRPGRHTPEGAEHSVVWWDPAALALGVEGDFGLRQEAILASGEGAEEAAQSGVTAYRAWQGSRREALQAGSLPSLEVVTVTALTEPPPISVPVRVEAVARSGDRPHGRRFGTLVHLLLRDARFETDEASLMALATAHGRALQAPVLEREAASAAAGAALGHELLRRAASAEPCWREVPFAVTHPDGRLVEGVIDLLFRDAEGWTVVDFKTDSEAAAGDAYRQQLGWYVWALRRLEVNEPISPVLLEV